VGVTGEERERKREREVLCHEVGYSAGIATGCMARGSIPGKGKTFLFSTASRQTSDPHPGSYSMCIVGDFQGGKAAEA
jgi:hypothetical protein